MAARTAGATAARRTGPAPSPLRWIVPLALVLLALFIGALLLLNADDDTDGDIDGEAITTVVQPVHGAVAA